MSKNIDIYHIPALEGEDAKQFHIFDSKPPTEKDLELIDEAEEFYLKNCNVSKKQ